MNARKDQKGYGKVLYFNDHLRVIMLENKGEWRRGSERKNLKTES